MKIIITMAGEGSRFKKIGFKVPKHEIIARDKTLFEWSMLSLIDFFDDEFIFLVRKGNYNQKFIEEKCNKLGIKNYKIKEVSELTDGQATTAMLADELIENNDEVAIYNIDTYCEEYEIKKSEIKKESDGLIPVFDAEGDKWSFVKLDQEGNVIDVSEKVRISNWGTIGFYHFKSWEIYKEIYYKYRESIKSEFKEVYIAPMYKYILKNNGKLNVSYIKNEKIHILGTPEDIEGFDNDYLSKNNL